MQRSIAIILKGAQVLEDKLLVWKLKCGKEDALCRIYDKYRTHLLRIAAGLLHTTSDAEDVVHDVFTDFVRDSSQFVLTGSLKAYLTTCVANRARNFNRAKQSQCAVRVENAEEVMSTSEGPEQWTVCNEQFMQLKAAMDRLPYEQKETILLRIQGQMKFREIARMQEVSVGTALSRYRYGLNKLRSIFNGEVE